jgi:drug/metabolite transporter (DMT)-like permease
MKAADALRADALLLLAAMVWGTGFVAQRLGMDHVGPLTFTAARFALGALALAPLALRRGRGVDPPGLRSARRRWPLAGGAVAGVALFTGAALQQAGLVTTEAGKAGFITGLYVIIVPLLGLGLGRQPDRSLWAAAVLAVVGLYLLSMSGARGLEPGDLYVLACAVMWAVHVLVVARVAPLADPIRLALVQFATVAVLGAAAALVFEAPRLADLEAAGGAIAYGGLLSVGVAFTIQIVAQRDAPPEHVAIILSLESVFAALAGWLWLGESLRVREVVGCAVMLAAMLLAQLWPLLRARRRRVAAAG